MVPSQPHKTRCFAFAAAGCLAVCLASDAYPSALETARASFWPSAPFTAGQTEGRHLRLGDEFEVTGRIEIFRPFGLALTREGETLIADMQANEVIKLDRRGEPIWRVGRRGQGPGEFQLLYRIALEDDGGLIAFDMRTREISWFTKTGDFEKRRQLPLAVLGIGTVVAFKDGSIAVSGVIPENPSASIHIFDSELRHQASFGPVPTASNPRILTEWGVGGITPYGQNELLFTRKLPYEIYRFNADGDLSAIVAGPVEFDRGPDDAFAVNSEGGAVRIQRTEPIPFPLAAWNLGSGWLLGAVAWGGDEGTTWDLFYEGAFVESFAAPHRWVVAAVDIGRQEIYVVDRDSMGNKAYVRVPYSLRPPSR